MLLFVRLALLILPFRLVARTLRAAISTGVATTCTADRIGWAVRTVARFLPGFKCLAQALTALALLRRHGHFASLRLGVMRDADGRLMAHAWVESGGAVISGGPHHLDYVPLPTALPFA